MTRNVEKITVEANGKTYSNWSHVHVRASLHEAVRTFGLEAVERFDIDPLTGMISRDVTKAIGAPYDLPPGTEVTIKANGDLVCKGFTNVYRPECDGKHHAITVEGRSQFADAVDGAVVHETGLFENKTPAEIAAELLSPYGFQLINEVKLDPIEQFHSYVGETVFQAIERSLRDQGATVMSDADGTLRITNGSKAQRCTGSLKEGVNITKFSARHSDEGRFSEIRVVGQNSTGSSNRDMRMAQTWKDRSVKRFRPKVLIHEGATTAGRALKRAQWEAERAQGFSVAASLIVQGWRDDGGALWTPNKLVYLSSPTLKIEGDMLIESMNLHQLSGKHNSGSLAELHLVHPIAYKGDAGKATKTDASWGYL